MKAQSYLWLSIQVFSSGLETGQSPMESRCIMLWPAVFNCNWQCSADGQAEDVAGSAAPGHAHEACTPVTPPGHTIQGEFALAKLEILPGLLRRAVSATNDAGQTEM